MERKNIKINYTRMKRKKKMKFFSLHVEKSKIRFYFNYFHLVKMTGHKRQKIVYKRNN